MPELGLLQQRRVLDQEHQAADQHLSVTSLRLNLDNSFKFILFPLSSDWAHLESVDKEIDNSRPKMIEVCQWNIPVSARHQLLDGHVGKVERESQQ